jgi:hypothetical protein
MPISGIVIRLTDATHERALRDAFEACAELSLGDAQSGAVAGVIDATDYLRHDALLAALARMTAVCAVDIVFHDFSDVEHFDRLPQRRASEGK